MRKKVQPKQHSTTCKLSVWEDWTLKLILVGDKLNLFPIRYDKKLKIVRCKSFKMISLWHVSIIYLISDFLYLLCVFQNAMKTNDSKALISFSARLISRFISIILLLLLSTNLRKVAAFFTFLVELHHNIAGTTKRLYF